jgi:hypothetical protein
MALILVCFIEFFVEFRLLELFDREVNHFDRPLNLNDRSDRIIGGIAWSRDGLGARETLLDENFARVHQMFEVFIGHGVTPSFLAGISNG